MGFSASAPCSTYKYLHRQVSDVPLYAHTSRCNPPYLLRSHSRDPIGARARMYVHAPYACRHGSISRDRGICSVPCKFPPRLASPRLACLTDCRLTDQQPWHYGRPVKHISRKTCPRQPSVGRIWIENTRIETLLLCRYIGTYFTAGTPCCQSFRLLRSPCLKSPQVMYIPAPLPLVSIHACVYTSKGCLFIAIPFSTASEK